ncbi:MAG: hypothetical protein K2L87_01770 [Clostridiales bacterium]|nr:hypothetical protein [Clostridiales bacterium]
MNLLSVQGLGALYTSLLLLICIIVIHGYKLARIGYRTIKKKLPPEPPKPVEKKPEPVYYIVEKKKKRRTKSTKTEYSTPKEIQFR